MHRFIELTVHTIPVYKHVSFICEMVYESSHQPLKFFLSRYHSANSHIYAVHLILAKDWLLRLWSLWSLHRDIVESELNRKIALIGILRLLYGKGTDDIQWTSTSVERQLQDITNYIHTLFSGTVEARFEKWYGNVSLNQMSQPKWVVTSKLDKEQFSNEQRVFFTKAVSSLACMSFES